MIQPILTRLACTTAIAIVLACASAAQAQIADRPWLDPALNAQKRAELAVKAMTEDEKLSLVFGYFSTDAPWKNFKHPADSLPDAAGFVPGIPRLGIPAQSQTDAGVGVATQRSPHPRERTTLPSGLATAATWNPDRAFEGGAMIGNEARLSGFNVMLAGGVNLMREPRNGRNFEYAGEDPLLAGIIVGNEVRGIQSNHVISTMKHYAFNDQSTSQSELDSQISDADARMSDLLAFQIVNEVGQPGSVMCSYNIVHGKHSCENPWLLSEVLKGDWGYKGYVMSDWGATHSTVDSANAGLDQDSGFPFDDKPYFGAPLKQAIADGKVPPSRLDDMATRILTSMFAVGLVEDPIQGDQATKIDYARNEAIAQTDAEEAIVLLKNNGILPLAKTAKTIAVIGAHADVGVLSGGGSSQVYPHGGSAVPNEGPQQFPGPMVWFPSSPLKGIAGRTSATVTFASGKDVQEAAALAAKSDIVVVFASQWTAEGMDVPDLNLPKGQDALISAVARANPKTVVVLETGGPVVMPWLNDVGAVVEAWFPGSSGGEAIARVLTGEVNPSGHLPATFPASLDQLPRPVIEGSNHGPRGTIYTAHYDIEGAAVGYKWFDKKDLKPLFPFGHGLSYTRFQSGALTAKASGKSLTASFTVTNTGDRDGKAVAQIYVSPPSDAGWEAPKRLGGWAKLDLKPGESRNGTVTVDPRLLGVYQSASKTWTIKAGDYRVMLANSAADIVATASVHLDAETLDVNGK
jgi:beta-glucosidase